METTMEQTNKQIDTQHGTDLLACILRAKIPFECTLVISPEDQRRIERIYAQSAIPNLNIVFGEVRLIVECSESGNITVVTK